MRENERRFREQMGEQNGNADGVRSAPHSRTRRWQAGATSGCEFARGPFAIDVAPAAVCDSVARGSAAAVAVHDRERQRTDLAGMSGEHSAVGRRDGHCRHGLGR